MWKRNRKNKQGGGVMFLIKVIIVDEVMSGKGLGEVLKVRIKEVNGEKRDLAVAYVPPKNKCLQHGRIQRSN